VQNERKKLLQHTTETALHFRRKNSPGLWLQHSKIFPLHNGGFYSDTQNKEYSAVRETDAISYWENVFYEC